MNNLSEQFNLTLDEFNHRHWEMNESTNSIAKSFGSLSPGNLTRLVKYNGGITRTHQETMDIISESGDRKKYYLNKNFFKTWSSEMAWVLGLIATDGCMSKDNPTVSLSSQDLEIIDKVKNILEYSGPIRNYDCYILSIYDRTMYSDLLSLGIEPAKSFTLELPNIPEEFMGDFIRGVLDGDGCISIDNRENRNPRLFVRIVTASKNFFYDLFDYLVSIGLSPRFELRSNRGGNRKDIYCLSFCGFNSISFLNYVYRNSNENVFMERKHNIFIDYMRVYGELYSNGPIRGRVVGSACVIDGCDNKKRYSSGLCQFHYNQNYRAENKGGTKCQ